MARKSQSQALEAEIARLPDLGLAELRARWKSLYGRPAPKFFRRTVRKVLRSGETSFEYEREVQPVTTNLAFG